jgi:hypothetical protein
VVLVAAAGATVEQVAVLVTHRLYPHHKEVMEVMAALV